MSNESSPFAEWAGLECEPGLVSVIIPCHDHEDYVAEAVRSALDQTYPHKEVIVVDDGSTDGSLDVIKSFGPRIRWETGPNRGAPAARNRGIALSRGEFIQFLDSDDVLCPGKLAGQVAAFRNARPRPDVVYGDWRRAYSGCNGELRFGDRYSIGQADDMVEALLAHRMNAVFSYLLARSAVVGSGGWDERLLRNQDFGFLLQIAARGARFLHVPGLTGYYRSHPGPQLSRQSLDVWAESTQMVLERAEDLLVRRGGMTPRRARALAEYFFAVGKVRFHKDRRHFRRALERARRLSPGCRPGSFVNRTLARFLGYECTEGILSLQRKLRGFSW